MAARTLTARRGDAMADLPALAARVWYGDDTRAALARAALSPLALAFGAVTTARAALYDAGVFARHPLPLPALSVGNLTVGGTGKTPVAAWCAARLRALGARPALVMRGVGGDEARVHALLNPDVPVVADPDRVRGAHAAEGAGADCVVLDDAFQHRRAARDVDLVLVAAERFDAGAVRLLPAGPYREGLAALRRASLAVVTCKTASPEVGVAIADDVAARGGGVPTAVVRLAPDALRRWDGADVDDVASLAGRRVLAVAGIAEPGAFGAQLARAGAMVDEAWFPDHHPFEERDAARLAERAARADRIVCTLKDAVKLGPRWPRGAPPLWYVSQRVAVERGEELLEGHFRRLLAARPSAPATPPVRSARAEAGAAGDVPAHESAGPGRRE